MLKKPLGLKLDFSFLERTQYSNINTNNENVNNESCYVNEDTMISRVEDRIYLGSETIANNKALMVSVGITHILNCSGLVSPNYYPETFRYKTLLLSDAQDANISKHIDDAVDYINDALRCGGSILIHCKYGISRSSAVVICYLMAKYNWTYEISYEYTRMVRKSSCPNAGFAISIIEWGKNRNTATANTSSRSPTDDS